MPRRARRRRQFGFNDNFSLLEEIGFGRDLGANTARFPVTWPDDGNAVAAYQAALQGGVKPIVNSYSWGYAPPTKREYAREMASMAEAMPRAIMQLWNEPNMGMKPNLSSMPYSFPGGVGPKKAAKYATAAARAIHRVNPKQRIIGPSVAPVGAWKQYTKRLYSHIPEGLVETGLNLYPSGKNRVKKVQRAVEMAAEFGNPVAVTELDVDAPWIPGDVPRKATRKAIRAARRAGAKTVLLHGYNDQAGEVNRRAIRRLLRG